MFEKLSKFKYGANILVVGHEPFLSKRILKVLSDKAYNNIAGITDIGSSGRHNHSSLSTPFLNNVDRCIILKKSGLAKLRISTKGQRLTGELRWLLTPKLLRKLSLAKKRNKIRSPTNLNAATEVVSPL